MPNTQQQVQFLLDYWAEFTKVYTGKQRKIITYKIKKHNQGKWNYARSLYNMLEIDEPLTTEEVNWIESQYTQLARN